MYTYVSSIVHLYSNMTQLDYSYIFTSCMYLHIYSFSVVPIRLKIISLRQGAPSCANRYIYRHKNYDSYVSKT